MHTQACLQVTSASSCNAPLACSGRLLSVECCPGGCRSWLIFTFNPGRWWARRSLGRLQECIIYFLSQNPCWKLLYIFSPQILTGNSFIFFLFPNPHWKLCRKCEKVNRIADDLQLRKSLWEETEELIGRALDSPSALP